MKETCRNARHAFIFTLSQLHFIVATLHSKPEDWRISGLSVFLRVQVHLQRNVSHPGHGTA